jgi:hypothetical protein
MIILDDAPFDAMIDGIVEDALIKSGNKEQIAEFEKEIGRKIGTASPEELELRKKAWDMPPWDGDK